MSFDRSALLAAFQRYNEATGTEIVSLEDLERKNDGDLAIFATGVLAALTEVGHSGNGEATPNRLTPALSDLLGRLTAIVGTGPFPQGPPLF